MNRHSQSALSNFVFLIALLAIAVGCSTSENTVVEQNPETSLSTEDGMNDYEELMTEKGEGI